MKILNYSNPIAYSFHQSLLFEYFSTITVICHLNFCEFLKLRYPVKIFSWRFSFVSVIVTIQVHQIV